ncbi:MAG: hypothetical protein ABIG85_02155 [Chloroflexota bacterium]
MRLLDDVANLIVAGTEATRETPEGLAAPLIVVGDEGSPAIGLGGHAVPGHDLGPRHVHTLQTRPRD